MLNFEFIKLFYSKQKYVEEARRADCLGFMRNGRIIEENTPEFLIDKYEHNVSTIKSVHIF
jgi:hypothetical protein